MAEEKNSQETSFSGFINYKQTMTSITTDLKKLREYSEKLDLNGNINGIDEILKRMANDNFNVAIVGEFKRGKSTVINALLGKNILPVDVLPTTATLNKITYNVTPFVTVEYKDGRKEQIGIEELDNYVTKLTRESEERAKTIKEAVVYYPINYCKNGVTIIDTPGLNDDAAMTEVTMSVLPTIDAALMVIMAQAPFSESERDFLESKIITSDLGRVLFVVTGIDLQDAGRASRELDKISAYAPEGGIVTADIIKMLVAPDERAKAYELTSALSSGNRAAAAEYLTRLSAAGVQSAVILRSLASTYRGLLFLRISAPDDNEAARALGVKPFAVKKMRPLAKKYSAVTLKRLADGLNDLEYHFKSGRLNVDEALNLAICRIMGVRINV